MTIGLVMIVRDEAAMIDACLASARPYISSWTIVDTGSKDDTPLRVRTALHDIPGRLYHRPWENFGSNRSQAFALARYSADWLLCLDADMTVEIDPAFQPDPALDAYLVELGEPDFSWRLPLLIRGDNDWRSVGAVHSYTALPDRDYRSEPTDAIKITMHGDRTSRAKTERQAEGLKAALVKNPDNPRTVFYLAQTYRELGKEPFARTLYQRRATMGDYEEERWYAAYRGALLAPEWSDRQAELIAAWEMRPGRLEPVHALAQQLNQRGQHQAAYRFASVPVVPTTDELFVHRGVWRWGMAFERSIAAWWVGLHEESAALEEALLAVPDLPESIREAVIRNQTFNEGSR